MRSLLISLCLLVPVVGCGADLTLPEPVPMDAQDREAANPFAPLKGQINIENSTHATFIGERRRFLSRKKIEIDFTLSHALPFGMGEVPEVDIREIRIDGDLVHRNQLTLLAAALDEANRAEQIFPIEHLSSPMGTFERGNRLAEKLVAALPHYQGPRLTP